MHIPFENSYSSTLPQYFYTKMKASPVSSPELIKVNLKLARELGLNLDEEKPEHLAQLFSGNQLPANAESIAQAYSGHQFGSFNPTLGDGRALLLGDIKSPDGCTYDIQLKGSGPTNYSRGGDGRSAIGPVIREYIISEAMHRLGVPTTRALAAVHSGDKVFRRQVTPGGVFTRVARSHVRVGTFEYFSHHHSLKDVQALADFVIAKLYPQTSNAENPYTAFFKNVVIGQANLVASWDQLGFIHGVMNTDNTSISCETIDYGPCAFMDYYSPDTVFSSIDRQGRYAFNNQARIAQWNLARLAECLLPLFDDNQDIAVSKAEELLGAFSNTYTSSWFDGMHRKLGINDVKAQLEAQDMSLIDEFLSELQQHSLDYTGVFRALSKSLDSQVECTELSSQWQQKWKQCLNNQGIDLEQVASDMNSINPIYIPRNHIVEEAIAAAEASDYRPFKQLVDILDEPYTETEGLDRFAQPSPKDAPKYQTFCGT